MKLTIVGCAGSFPRPDSAASAYLVEADDDTGRTWRVLLDLGNGSLGPLQRYLDPAELDAVLLSHLHPDHCLDLCGLYVALRYRPGGPPSRRLPVIGPVGVEDRMADAYGREEGRKLADLYEYREWTDSVPVTVGPLTVVPMIVDHPVEAYGLRVEQRVERQGRSRTAVLAYSGDTDACPALVRLARGADVLLAEAAFTEGRDLTRHIHLTGRRAGQVATDAGARRLLLTHLPMWTDPATALAEATSTFAGDVEVVAPGSVYRI
ncbi:MAG TPA: MBL fold metallo-hydrolase [Kineosporiaceae bacterium]